MVGATPAAKFVLLTWINLALPVPVTQLKKDPAELEKNAAWVKLVEMAALLIWGTSPSSASIKDQKINSVSNSAHHDVWRTLRSCPVLTAPMLSVLTRPASGSEAGVLIGNIVGTAIRLADKPGKSGDGGAALQQVEQFKDTIVSYIDKVLISAKAPVSYASVADLGDFLRRFVAADFDKLFKPSITKMLLRSPEAVLPTCYWLLKCLSNDVDLAAVYIDMFADQIASNLLKSSKDKVRETAALLFESLASTPRSIEDATKAAEIATKPLTAGRYTQADHRVVFYNLLGSVRAGPGNGWASSVAILPALLKMTAKETQEAPVNAVLSAIGSHVSAVIEYLRAAEAGADGAAQCEEALKAFSDAAKKGLALPDKSALVRQAWAANAIGEPLWSAVAQLGGSTHLWFASSVHPLVQALAAVAVKAAANPLTAGTTLEAHVGVALALHSAEPIPNANANDLIDLVTKSEKSLLLWDKVYHKAASPRELTWVLRAAEMLFNNGCRDPRLAGLITWSLCRFPEPTLATTRGALQVVQAMSASDAARLWELVEPSFVAEMAKSLEMERIKYKWTGILAAVASGINAEGVSQEKKSDVLVSMALAAHHPAVLKESGRSSFWIETILRARVDPGELCHGFLAALRQAIELAMQGSSEGGQAQFDSAVNLIKDLVFIGSDSVALRLLEFARESINPDSLSLVSQHDIAVWRTPKDQLLEDPVVEKERAKQGGKNKKDDWEAQLREELARKHNKVRKLTSEEQEMVDKQWAKENAARAKVEAAYHGLTCGLATVRAVVSGSLSVASTCMLELVRIVVERAVIGGGSVSEALAGEAIRDTLLDMSKAADGLEEALRTPIAMGLLRARGFASV
ncbi:translational activator of GCN4, partial [Linderina pennispora]